MSLQNHALYQVATKALIHNQGKYLVLITPDGYLDFPGGRVDETERDIPWTEALKREIAEEVGDSLTVDVGRTLFVSKRQYHKEGVTHYIAAIFYECQYSGGDIEISGEHTNYNWLTREEIIDSKLKFVSEDERQQLRMLFSSAN